MAEPPGEISTATPEEVGMSSERLLRVNQKMQQHIDSGRIQGAVTAVARRGKVVHFEAHGLMDVESGREMEKDAIFRMASSTKPILGAAAMMMIEEGLIRTTNRVSRFIPEFEDMQVAVLKDPVDEDISPRTIELMASNHVGNLFGGMDGSQSGMGFGYTVSVVLDPIAANSQRAKGAFGWGGAFGTVSWTDPKEELTAVLMLQQPHLSTQYDFGNAIRQAIID